MPRLLHTLVPALLLATASALPMAATPTPDDPYLWLEDVQGEKALAWVRERNAATRTQLQAYPDFAKMRDTFRSILDSREKIPYFSRQGDRLYNFWRDADHQRGLWRRTTLAEYRKAQPNWETVVDLDALAKAEKENWVWSGASCLGPDYRRCLLRLSRGGADAVVVREFDVQAKRFVDDGFKLPEAKSQVDWIDENTVYVGTDFGPGSMTDSGYPRIVKRWQRGQPLAQAVTVFEGKPKDVYAFATVDRTPGFERTLFGRASDFYNSELSLLQADGKLQVLDRPSDSDFTFWRDRLLVQLRSDWNVGGKTWPAGSLLVTDAKAYLAGKREFTALFTPTATRSLAGVSITRSQVLLNVLDNVAGKLEEWHLANGQWQRREVKAPFPGTLGASALHDPLLKDDPLAEAYLVTYTDFLTPDSLMLGRTGSDERELLKARPAFFDAAGIRVEQRFATSKDGTKVPYFVVWPAGAKADGKNPTLLYGYGGFEVSQQPWYSAGFGTAWYAHGGVLVVANIRGGGEFGPAWHQAAVKAHKQKSYDDFAAVAEDIIASKISTPAQLGIEGGSNGGLLVGAVMLQRPELFKAVVCQVPLLDMKRYHRLLAGASWMAEYGDPDKPEEWAWISKYSPYQNVKPGQKLPKVLFITSTRDDRVHPGHARKMTARMTELGYAPLYYENIEGGHGAAADNVQKADMMALEFSFLWQQLGRK
ncbi:prolyl oligopeptidase family protein [Aquabacterium sp.]|uniref:prolyl oligopeptidase family serine peptidase n=1 Tax=Aquabacterium sp. TaxID=1872578 RepID=UPI0037833927